MRLIETIWYLLFIVVGWSSLSYAENTKPSMTLDSIFKTSDFKSQRIRNLQWAGDGKSFTFTRPDSATGLLNIYEYSIADGSESLILASGDLKIADENVRMSGYQFTGDRQYVLIKGPVARTWNSIFEAPYYVYDMATQSLVALADGNPHLRNVFLSPASSHVGYVRDKNLYVRNLASGKVKAVTKDGSANIWNGIFDYGSTEFGFTDAWKWSPDGKKIAFWRLDVTDVKTWSMIYQLGKYPDVKPLKCANTAEKHAVNQIGVYTLRNAGTKWMDIGDNPDDYIPFIEWTPSSDKLSIQRLTRNQDVLNLLMADVRTGKSNVIVTDTDPAWIEITQDLMFLEKSDQFVFTSEKSGYRHAYLYDYEGNEKQLTSGDWAIVSLIGVDEVNRWLYFYAKEKSLIEQHVYRVSLDGSLVEKLSDKSGWYDWDMSPDGSSVVQTWSDAATPPVVAVRKPAGGQLTILIRNELPGMKKYSVPNPEFFQFDTHDGITLNAYMIRPTNFDPDKKYPVITFGYGNAGSQMVVDTWGSERDMRRDIWHRYMAEQGYIIFSMDNRTTAGRGKKAKNLTYGEYGKWAVLDQLQGRHFLETLPYVDADRVGFWGWSGGGYLTAAMMTKGAPHYKVGVSVAPVIDLVNYQAVGVERWMGLLKDNPDGYARVNLINYADRLEGDLLLIHGTGDENVKFAFTLQFADALINANKQFDMMVYPNEHHGMEGVQLHLYTKITNYFKEKL